MLKNSVKKYCSDGSKINQIIAAILMVFPIFSYGTAVGWLSPMGPHLMSDDTPAASPVHPDVISWMASMPYFMGIPAVFIVGFLVDNYGRKKSMMFTSASLAVCWGLKLYSTQTWALITARAVLGFGVAGCYVVTPLYLKEISEDSIRGTLGSLVVLSQNFGNLLMYIMGEYLSYREVLWMCLIVPILHMLLFITMPETPSYLLKCGKSEDARNALAWLRCRQSTDPYLDTELQILQLELEQKTSGKFFPTLKRIVSDRSTFRAFRITLVITIAREFCGCIAVINFASTIFSASGSFVLSPNQQAAMLGVVQLIGSCTASSLMERTGRKRLLGGTSAVSGLAMGALAAWFSVRRVDADGVGGTAWVPVAALCLCIYCDAAGLQPVPFVIMTEMFSFQNRGVVTTLVISFTCALVSMELRVFHPLATMFGLHVIFWLFSAVCIASTVYIALYVPETKKKSVEQIYEELSDKEKDCEANVTRL